MTVRLLCLLAVLSTISVAKDFPEGKGRDAVAFHCTQCHSGLLVLQNAMTREAWDRTITKMQTKYGLYELEAPLRREMLDYLAANFSPKATVDAMDGLGPRQVNPLPE